MTVDEFARSEGYWKIDDPREGDIVLASSVSYFRNLADRPFPHKLNKKDKKVVTDLVLSSIEGGRVCDPEGVFTLGDCSARERHILQERNVVFEGVNGDSTVVLFEEGSCCIVLNGRDHFCLTVRKPGIDFGGILELGGSVIHGFEEEIDFARSREHGVLTARPAYSGAGMELSVTLHLAGFSNAGRINELLMELEKDGMGLKSGWIDGYYTVYNRSARRYREDNWYEQITAAFQRAVDQEREVRVSFYGKNRSRIQDKVWRSYGLLLSSRLISLFEALELLSHIRFGLSLGIIDYIPLKHINLLLNYVQDYHLISRYRMEGEGEQVEEARARFIRDYLKEVL